MNNYTLDTIGESGLITLVRKLVKKVNRSIIKGIGDDAAVLRFNKDKYLLCTSDMLIENVHFNRSMRPFDIGHKALACSISDIAAMGGEPKYAIISLGLPRDLKISFIKNLYRGIISTANIFRIDVVGGDTNRSKKIIIDVTLLGEVKKRNLILRSKAEVNDIIFVTGKLGASFRTEKHLSFKPRLKESQFLINRYRINSMIDISDGLVQDLIHILEESRKGAIIYEEAIPINREASLDNALYDGEDYELLFTLSAKQASRLKNDLAQRIIKFSISEIGKINDKKNTLEIIDRCGRKKMLKDNGFEHF
jgi:thiamine-monophosphate kinase